MSLPTQTEISHAPVHPSVGLPSRPAPTVITQAGEHALRADLSKQIKEEEVVVVSRILRLEALLNSATVVDEPEISEPEIVSIGAIVGAQDLSSGALRSHRLVGGFQPLAPGEVSANSPVGRALYGRDLGSEVSVELPDGGIRALKIVSLRYPS